jgi:hypothetical protein
MNGSESARSPIRQVNPVRDISYQLIASHTITPDRNDWRNERKNPGRWPGNLSPMTRLICHL